VATDRLAKFDPAPGPTSAITSTSPVIPRAGSGDRVPSTSSTAVNWFTAGMTASVASRYMPTLEICAVVPRVSETGTAMYSVAVWYSVTAIAAS
jgi:hypothetical protein